ncbi:hypothetical protein E1281_11735 [Actinomadura sp. KC345]|uniref:hypothetical protein n=1 Tax=Actinomadura sp. KC345 TaxID=2530371 RepID=UPI0010527511|nr:hypothetical protein [Actinomadura sp. KC345]TDC55597.1 hypothetical protein E1281_11735 [Actinomadura sp. KC345]
MRKIQQANVHATVFGGILAALLFGMPTFWWLHLAGADHAGVFFKAIVICAVLGGIGGRGGSASPELKRLRDLMTISLELGIKNYVAAFGLLLLAATPLTDAAVLSVSSAGSMLIGFIIGQRSRRWLHCCTTRQGRPAIDLRGSRRQRRGPRPMSRGLMAR